MNYSEWIFAGVVAGIIILLFSAARFAANRAWMMAKYTMTIFLDESHYQHERNQFLKLIESTRAENSGVLLQAVMFNLEDAAERVAAAKLIGIRMWQINQKALQTGQSVTKILEDAPMNPSATYPNFERNIAVSQYAVKVRIALKKIRRRINQYFGF